jgi:TPR repeat protein
LRLFKQSANSGNSQAQYNLGTMYQNAIGVEQDFKKAVKYYKLAAKQGHKEAKENLKMLCEQDSTLCK